MPFLEQVRALGPKVVATHKGLGGPDPACVGGGGVAPGHRAGGGRLSRHRLRRLPLGLRARTPTARKGPTTPPLPTTASTAWWPPSRPPASAPEGTSTPNWAAPGSSCCVVRPRRPTCSGKLLTALGPDRIMWGTDSIWYGSPQPLIDAFRAFQIPESFQEQFGYPALTVRDEGEDPQPQRPPGLRRVRRGPGRRGRVARRLGLLGRGPRWSCAAPSRPDGHVVQLRPHATRSQRSGRKNGPQVLDDEVRLLGRGEVAAPGHLGPVHQVGVLLGQPAGDEDEVLGEHGDARRRLDRRACARGPAGWAP